MMISGLTRMMISGLTRMMISGLTRSNCVMLRPVFVSVESIYDLKNDVTVKTPGLQQQLLLSGKCVSQANYLYLRTVVRQL